VTHGDFLTLGIANVSDVEGMASTPRTELEAVGSTYLARRRAAVDAALTASGCVAPSPLATRSRLRELATKAGYTLFNDRKQRPIH
jgi:hypothetical protein